MGSEEWRLTLKTDTGVPEFFAFFQVLGAEAGLDKDFKGFERLELARMKILKEFHRNLKDFRRFPKVPEASGASALLIF